MERAESLLLSWIVKGFTLSAKRAAQFRSLGRGWTFVQLSMNHTLHGKAKTSERLRKAGTGNRTRFKWWFEGVPRVLRNRQSEFKTMHPDITQEVNKWTVGYVHGAELVFVVRGFSPGGQLISRRKWRENCVHAGVWAPNKELQEALEAPQLTEEERGEQAKKAEALAIKKRSKRDRQKQKQKAQDQAGPTDAQIAKERAEAEKASALWEATLREFAEEDAEAEAAAAKEAAKEAAAAKEEEAKAAAAKAAG